MGNPFAITTPTNEIKTDAGGKALAVFTVTNNLGRPVRGMARARALESTQQDWLDIEGETERDFPVGGTQQFTVNFNKTGAPDGTATKFPFRLDVASSSNPDEEFSEGPTVIVEAAKAPPPAAAKSFPWWIILVGVAVIVLVGGGIWFFAFSGEKANAKVVGTWVNNQPSLQAPVVSMEIRPSGGSEFNLTFTSIAINQPFGPVNGKMLRDGKGEAEGTIQTGYVLIQLDPVEQNKLGISLFFYQNASSAQGNPTQTFKQTLTKQ